MLQKDTESIFEDRIALYLCKMLKFFTRNFENLKWLLFITIKSNYNTVGLYISSHPVSYFIKIIWEHFGEDFECRCISGSLICTALHWSVHLVTKCVFRKGRWDNRSSKLLRQHVWYKLHFKTRHWYIWNLGVIIEYSMWKKLLNMYFFKIKNQCLLSFEINNLLVIKHCK